MDDYLREVRFFPDILIEYLNHQDDDEFDRFDGR